MSDLARFKAAIVKTWSAQVWDGLIDAMQARLAPLEEQLDIERATTERIVQRALGVIDEAIAPLLTAMQDGLATATTELAAIDEAYRTDGEARVDGIINPLVAQAQADLAAAALALAMLEAGVAANSAKLGGELPGFYLDPANFTASANVKTMLAAANNAAIRAAVGAQAALGYTPLNRATDTMLGPLLLAASAAGGAGLNLPPGVAPSAPANGDIFPTTTELAIRLNGQTIQIPVPAGQVAGDILYRGAGGWERLAKGTAGQVLVMNAGATAPEWVTPSPGVPAGTIGWTAGSTAPSGWLKRNGALLSRTAYADLFAKIGTTFGAGDGSTTFAAPETRADFVRDLDDGRGIDVGRTLGSYQADQMQQITGSFSNLWGVSGGATVAGALDTAGTTSSRASSGSTNGSHTVTFNSANSPGARTGAETRPRNTAFLGIIKY